MYSGEEIIRAVHEFISHMQTITVWPDTFFIKGLNFNIAELHLFDNLFSGTEVEALRVANQIRNLGLAVELEMTGKKIKKCFVSYKTIHRWKHTPRRRCLYSNLALSKVF